MKTANIFAIISALFLVTVLSSCNRQDITDSDLNVEETSFPFSVEIQLVRCIEYDPSYYYDKCWIVYDSPITNYEYIGSEDWVQKFSQRDKFDMPDSLDYDSYSYIMTYGRKVAEFEIEYKNGDDFMPTITFEEEHQGNYVFIYQLKKMFLYPFRWNSYIMSGSEKVFIGTSVYDFNEIDTEREGFIEGK